MYKKCSRCQRELPATPDYFNRHKKNKDGLNGICRDCRMAQRRTGKPTGRPPIDTTDMTEKACTKCGNIYPLTSEYWNRDKRGLASFMSICKECRRLVKKAWAEANPDKYKAMKRSHHIRHREKDLKRSSDWQRAHLVEIRPSRTASANKRRAQKALTGGSHTPEQIQALLIAQDFKCAYCGKDISKRFERDHVLPLSRGGSDDISNIAMCCKSCNSSKNNKTLHEWQPDRFPPP